MLFSDDGFLHEITDSIFFDGFGDTNMFHILLCRGKSACKISTQISSRKNIQNKTLDSLDGFHSDDTLC